MIEICLYTREGGYVCTVRIPPFQRLPEVMIWGSRCFILDEDPLRRFDMQKKLDFKPNDVAKRALDAPIYIEGMAWAVLDVPPFGVVQEEFGVGGARI